MQDALHDRVSKYRNSFCVKISVASVIWFLQAADKFDAKKCIFGIASCKCAPVDLGGWLYLQHWMLNPY